MTAMRIVFAGSPTAAVPSLRAIAASAHEIAAVVTREPSPLGRKRIRTPTPIATAARDLGLGVLEANRLSADVTEAISALKPDLGVIVAYGGLVRSPLLHTPRLGWINLHFSLLPRWRGAAPVQHAIIAGDDVTGASVFQLVDELDAGPVFGTLTQAIGRNETAGHLLETLADSGSGLLRHVIDMIASGTAQARDQTGDVSFAPKLTLEDGRVDWTLAASRVHQRIRGVTPEPGAFTLVGGARVKILEAAIARDAVPRPPGKLDFEAGRVLAGTASEPIELLRVQPAGKKPMGASDWWRGRAEENGLTAE